MGYGLGNQQVIDVLNRVRAPFNVNAMALIAGVAALQDQAFVQASVKLNREGLNTISKGLIEQGLGVIPSVGNFICIDFKQDAQPIFQALLEQGVITRPLANYNMPNHLRVTVGTEDENFSFMNALGKVINS